ncbi:MAG: HD domain-containing protein [Planctomycetota bacterium]
MSEKIIRDPVHDVIALRTEDDTEGLLFELLNAREFQRLRRIRQLGMASLAYPGADHSRYSHSLGVMQTARRMLDRLERNHDIDAEQRKVALCAALLHDLGHGPFSHVFERVTGIHHERLSARVINDPTTEVHQLLITHDKSLPERITELLACAGPPTFLSDLISSQLDADRVDYLLRDNLMTGSRYGRFDMTWLLTALTIDPHSRRLAVLPKAVSAVEAYLMARYHMYRNVYFHKVVRAAEGMVQLILQRAKRLAVQGRLEWSAATGGVEKALTGNRLTTPEFLDLDDAAVMQCFKAWTSGTDPLLASLCRGMIGRKLYKTVELAGHPDPAAAVESAKRAVESVGGDPEYHLFYDQVTDTPYKTAGGEFEGDRFGTEILVAGREGPTPIAQVSPMVNALAEQLRFSRLHVAAAYRDVAAEAANPKSQ